MDSKGRTVTKLNREFGGSIPDQQPAIVRTLCPASLERALELYDFVIFMFFTPVIGKLFFAAGLADWIHQLQNSLNGSIVTSQGFGNSQDLVT